MFSGTIRDALDDTTRPTGLQTSRLVHVGAWTSIGAQDRTSDEAAVRALDEQARLAALSRDVPALERLWSDQLVVKPPTTR